MSKNTTSLRFRQIHLDFHTSPAIPDIGRDFDKGRWQDRLLGASVDSITLFAKCHHGLSYHPTGVGRMHPGLGFDLLRAQYEATKEAGIRAPIYLSAGVDNVASEAHPEWREVDAEGRFAGWVASPLQAGFHTMDFHSPYLDYLCDQIREVVRLFPECDGIFLDIISQQGVCGRWSLDFMTAEGLDPDSPEDRGIACRRALEKYYRATTAAARTERDDMPVFHNGGHIPRGRKEILGYFSHLELESLPTGGWGYDHFPMSAKYVCNLGMEYLGMTGKFHTTWGEFGGYKHPNALRYECAAMLAHGARCSVGDQLHPNGELDPSTYAIVGEAYREVREKEPFCLGAEPVFDIAVLSSEAENAGGAENAPDAGANRILLEEHFLFGLIDRSMDFSVYKALVLPDDIRVDPELKAKLEAYLENGGRLILSGESGLEPGGSAFAIDIGAEYHGPSPSAPPDDEPNRGHDYVLPLEALRAEFADAPQIMYERSQRIRPVEGRTLGDIHDPYFNRDWRHFCSHQHAPYRPEASGYACGVAHGRVLYFSHPVFRHYRTVGAVANRRFVANAIRSFLGDSLRLRTSMPSTARVTLTRQPAERRYLLHLLYAPTVSRGGAPQMSGGNASVGRSVEVIEELPKLTDLRFELSLDQPVEGARLAWGGEGLETNRSGKTLELELAAFSCHSIIEIPFA